MPVLARPSSEAGGVKMPPQGQWPEGFKALLRDTPGPLYMSEVRRLWRQYVQA